MQSPAPAAAPLTEAALATLDYPTLVNFVTLPYQNNVDAQRSASWTTVKAPPMMERRFVM